jgi:hypothetical protein
MYAAVLETSGHNRRRSAAVHGRNATGAFARNVTVLNLNAPSALAGNAAVLGPSFISARATGIAVRGRHTPNTSARSPAP